MHAYQARERKSKTVNNNRSQLSAHRGAAFHPQSNNTVQAQFQQMANSSSHVKQLQAYQRMADNNTVIQKKENKTGMPDRLKAGVERLSGMDLSDVRVHYNSSKPAQLRAMAYAQGTDIYIAPGQEKHLPHEAWHVVQQKQGRVKPTAMQAYHTNNNGNNKKTAQLFRPINMAGKDGWNNIKPQLPGFRPQFEIQGQLAELKYRMRYIQGPPISDMMNVSKNGNMAISADNMQQQSFFVSEPMLGKSNGELAAAKSKFRLEPTGAPLTLHNYPTDGETKNLIQVTAVYSGGNQAAIELQTQCHLYYKNITAASDKLFEIYDTTVEEGTHGEISMDKKLLIDSLLQKVQLRAGDAFKLFHNSRAVKNMINGAPGWNMHYAGMVAVDDNDQVTLENYNRKTEFTDQVFPDMMQRFNDTTETLDDKIYELQKDLKKDNLTQTDITTLTQRKQLAEQKLIELNTYFNIEDRDQISTHYFKMYGPSEEGQSFLDQWRALMETKQSKFSVLYSNRE